MLPKIYLDSSIRDELSAPWEDALVVKLLGKDVGFLTMRDRLKKLWQPSGGFDIIDLGFGFFLIKFDNGDDRGKAVEGGPWMMFDHYLLIRPWSLDIVASSAKIDTTLMWIQIPSLNVGYYDEDVLLSVASLVGKPMKIDLNIPKVAQEKFARVCIEINLNQLVVGKVYLDDRWYCLEYEDLHIICASCGFYGHHSKDCSVRVIMESNNNTAAQVQEVSLERSKAVEGEKVNPVRKNSPSEIVGIESQQLHGDWLTITRKEGNKSHQFLNKKCKILMEIRGVDFMDFKLRVIYVRKLWGTWPCMNIVAISLLTKAKEVNQN